MFYRVINSNEALVVSGKGTGKDGYKIQKGGAKFIVPIVQKAQKLSLEPFVVEIDLNGALSKENIRVNVPSAFTLAVSDDDEGIKKAAKRIIDLSDDQLNDQAEDIIMGQLRAVIATLRIEEINTDREKFENLVESNVSTELAKLGLALINVNIRDIQDESGYINAIGQKAEAEAKQQASVDIAEAKRAEQIGTATAEKEAIVKTKELETQRVLRTKELEKERIERETQLEMEQIEAQKENKIKTAQANKEIEIAEINFAAEQEVAKAEANITLSQKKEQEELADKRATDVVQETIAKEKALIKADTEAEKILKNARAEAESIKLKAEAEAESMNKIWEAKAQGLSKVVEAVGRENLSSVLMIEKIEEVQKINAEALSNLKIDKITVWDNGKEGQAGKSGLAGFVDNFSSSIPAMHEIAKDAGIKLPGYLGESVAEDESEK